MGGETSPHFMNEFPIGVGIILGIGLAGTAYIIYYILKEASKE